MQAQRKIPRILHVESARPNNQRCLSGFHESCLVLAVSNLLAPNSNGDIFCDFKFHLKSRRGETNKHKELILVQGLRHGPFLNDIPPSRT